MFSHIVIGTNNIDHAQIFYDGLLAVLGAGKGVRMTIAGGQQRLVYVHGGSMLGITEPIDGNPATPANGGTLGFACRSVEQVRQFQETAVVLGGLAIEDPPGVRDTPGGPVYLAYVRDLDGNKLCAACRM